MLLDPLLKWDLELSAPIQGEKKLNFDLANEQLSINESNLFGELLGASGYVNSQRIFIASLFKNTLIFLYNPSCSEGIYQCLYNFDDEKILIQKSAIYYIQDQRKTYAVKIELFKQSENYFNKVIFYLHETRGQGQEDTDLLILKIILKIQDCSNVRN